MNTPTKTVVSNWGNLTTAGAGLVLLALAVTSIAILPAARAQTCPEFCDGNGNVALGNVATIGIESTAIGNNVLNFSTGSYNTATGFQALERNVTGNNNTAAGVTSLSWNQNASGNTAVGFQALQNSDHDGSGSASDNTAIGAFALSNNITAGTNTATGFDALFTNTSGPVNTATGAYALYSNTTGQSNVATGASALQANVTHSYNTAAGFEALANADADDNTASGALSLNSDTTGQFNTATGVSALFKNSTGSDNTAAGVSALYFNISGHDDTAQGYQALLHNTGSNNVGVGSNAGANLTSGSNNIDIGANVPGVAGEANTIRIGKQGTQKATFIAGVAGSAATGSTVVVTSLGKLGVATSSARFKEQIKPMNDASEAILRLKPVSFRYKEEVDPDKAPQFGLVAEDVEKVAPDLVAHDDQGKPFTVRYEAVNAMLLNEFLKEHRVVEELTKQVATLNAAAKAQAEEMQKIRAQVQVSNPASATLAEAQ